MTRNAGRNNPIMGIKVKKIDKFARKGTAKLVRDLIKEGYDDVMIADELGIPSSYANYIRHLQRKSPKNRF